MKWFTAVEILIVVVILLILVSLVVGAVIHSQQSARYQRWVAFKQNIRADDDLMAYYTFEEGEGDVLANEAMGAAGDRDYKPEDFNGTIVGAKWEEGAGRWSGKSALYFDGVHDHVDLGLFFGRSSVSAITVLVWVRPLGPDRKVVVSADGDENWELAIGPEATGARIEWITTDDTSVTNTERSNVALSSDWHLLVGWYDSKGLLVDKRILLDSAEPVGSAREHYGRLLGDGSERWRTYVTIGAASRAGAKGGTVDLSDGFHGYIDEVLVYSRALTDQEVKDHWRMGTH